MTTAQETFRIWLRDVVSPTMRGWGLKGSAGNYALPSDTHFALIGFQRSTSSNALAVKFTVNVKVVGRQDWEAARVKHPWLPARPSANSRYPADEWSERIGLLMPQRENLWWWIDAVPSEEVTRDVIAAVRDYGLPAIREAVARRA